MNLTARISLLTRLGEYMNSDADEWLQVKERASRENGWFIPEFVDRATNHISNSYLTRPVLERWTSTVTEPVAPKKVGIVMAGNIPLVGFHDWLAVFVTGHTAMIKLSGKDAFLLPHLLSKLQEWSGLGEDAWKSVNETGDMLKGCDAYIATGSNNSAGYFEYYFSKYPHIIRRNRTSVAILSGDESLKELELLADDVYQYFGLGCRNVTKIYVPREYDFVPLLTAFRKYSYLADHHKYKNNFDYNLAIHLLNKKLYMSNESILIVEEASFFSPISQLNYEFFDNRDSLIEALKGRDELQCMVGKGLVPFGQAQYPGIDDYADGADTLRFLTQL